MKVYVITKGGYSDYHICAVATDPEKAEKLAKIYSDRWDTAEVEEYDTEENPDWFCGRVPYEVRFWRTAGPTVYLWYVKGFTPGIKADQPSSSLELTVFLYAPDAETALKIAQDKRAEYWAQQAGR